MSASEKRQQGRCQGGIREDPSKGEIIGACGRTVRALSGPPPLLAGVRCARWGRPYTAALGEAEKYGIQAQSGLGLERVQQRHAEGLEVGHVAGHHRQAVDLGGGRNHGVLKQGV